MRCLASSPQWGLLVLYDTYSDIAWAKDFGLEKLSLRERGLLDIVEDATIVGRGFQEVASVLLPGTMVIQPEPWTERWEYAGKSGMRPASRVLVCDTWVRRLASTRLFHVTFDHPV